MGTVTTRSLYGYDPTPPLPCRKCGGKPRIVDAFEYGRGREASRVYYWVECRRWLGLRLCQRTETMCNFKDWSDLARNRAIIAWDAAQTEAA
jgi:hypothetical protein